MGLDAAALREQLGRVEGGFYGAPLLAHQMLCSIVRALIDIADEHEEDLNNVAEDLGWGAVDNTTPEDRTVEEATQMFHAGIASKGGGYRHFDEAESHFAYERKHTHDRATGASIDVVVQTPMAELNGAIHTRDLAGDPYAQHSCKSMGCTPVYPKPLPRRFVGVLSNSVHDEVLGIGGCVDGGCTLVTAVNDPRT